MAKPPGAPALPFANDGSFMEQFMKMQEEAAAAKGGAKGAAAKGAAAPGAGEAAGGTDAPAEAVGGSAPPSDAAGVAAPQAAPPPAVVVRKKSVIAVQVRDGAPAAKRPKADEAPAEGGGLSAHYLAELKKFQSLTGEKTTAAGRPLMK